MKITVLATLALLISSGLSAMDTEINSAFTVTRIMLDMQSYERGDAYTAMDDTLDQDRNSSKDKIQQQGGDTDT